MIRLRKAELEDQEFIGKVCLGTHKLYAPFMGDAFIKQAHKYEDALPSGYHIDIIEDNEKQLGFVGYKRKTEKVMYITAFYLLDIYYGQGYGTKTMNYLVDEFQKNGMKEVLLEVHKKANWAQKFYAKQGFKIAYGIDIYKNDVYEKEMTLLYKEIV
ncbi:GNAT family N-acetyltransferase [Cellulosilyticum ruminicola]|uniref:GNAT family N-acetyltransferase n=1 Tax=Cellulosilyticum ruminicola TaxID=425254 RepID=UPI0006CF8B95|nr:GNAT family N-acetyltransferase [Cellulosilyticum ruminicola]